MATISVPVTKGKGTVELDLENISTELYEHLLVLGAKELINRGMSKITKAAMPDEEERQAAAMAKAAENLEAMYAGKVRMVGAKAKKESGAVMTEARRLARNLVKGLIKQAGGKISHYEASEITKAANEMLAGPEGEGIIADARATIAEKEAKEKAIKFDVSQLRESPKLVKAAEERKAAQKAQRELAKATVADSATRRGRGNRPQAH